VLVGNAVGSDVVGVGVGSTDGCAVGDHVGADDGSVEGNSDGCGVGDVVGVNEGKDDGVGVG
jgi:hypothetical protein